MHTHDELAEPTTVKSLIKEYEINELMGKIIDHCFDRWSEKDLLIANRIKQFVSDFLERKLAQAIQEAVLARESEIVAELQSIVDEGYPNDMQDYINEISQPEGVAKEGK